MLASSCSSIRQEKAVARIMVVDEHGLPVQGAFVSPEIAEHSNPDMRKLTDEETAARTSDLQGLVYADLELYYWDSDGCYHLVVRRGGYKQVVMSVSKELFPPLLRITLEANSRAPGHP